MLSTEQEKAGSLYFQVEQYFNEIEALKEENVTLRKELEKNEAAVNEGFMENKMLSEKFHILRSKLSRLQKVGQEVQILPWIQHPSLDDN